MELIHRDDMPPGIIEDLKRKHQVANVACAGDAPGGKLPPEVQAYLVKFKADSLKSLATGTCFDCGAKIQDYRPWDNGWTPPKGWGVFHNTVDDEPMFWQCPECDTGDGESRSIGITVKHHA